MLCYILGVFEDTFGRVPRAGSLPPGRPRRRYRPAESFQPELPSGRDGPQPPEVSPKGFIFSSKSISSFKNWKEVVALGRQSHDPVRTAGLNRPFPDRRSSHAMGRDLGRLDAHSGLGVHAERHDAAGADLAPRDGEAQAPTYRPTTLVGLPSSHTCCAVRVGDRGLRRCGGAGSCTPSPPALRTATSLSTGTTARASRTSCSRRIWSTRTSRLPG